MIKADKEQVEQHFRLRMLQIREKELDYYILNSQSIAQISALLVGCSWSALVETSGGKGAVDLNGDLLNEAGEGTMESYVDENGVVRAIARDVQRSASPPSLSLSHRAHPHARSRSLLAAGRCSSGSSRRMSSRTSSRSRRRSRSAR